MPKGFAPVANTTATASDTRRTMRMCAGLTLFTISVSLVTTYGFSHLCQECGCHLSHGRQLSPSLHHDRQETVGACTSTSRFADASAERGDSTNSISEYDISQDPSSVVDNSCSQIDNDYETLQAENIKLKEELRIVVQENQRLQQEYATRTLVLESFEGENSFPLEVVTDESCNPYEDACPLEPTVSFGQAFRDRATWLVGLLIMQSLSGIILSHNEVLLENHPISKWNDLRLANLLMCLQVVFYLTMLVGAGGNAGNQASVRVIRGLALGTLNKETQFTFLTRELKMAACLSATLALAGFVRTAVFRTPIAETIAVTSALFLIVFSSVGLGAVLPLMLRKLGVDPAHSSTTIQVIMDILGVLLAVLVSSLMLDSPFGQTLIGKLTTANLF